MNRFIAAQLALVAAAALAMKTTTLALSSLVLAATLGGCGGDTYVNQGSTTISKGTELTDLQRALGEGAITQGEYDQLRAKVMRRPN